ncbi:hypothetical protein E4U41_004243 [Claviceps citrina]|nr:hypothetical protein E4U41_004243 [Claviceps citrina]
MQVPVSLVALLSALITVGAALPRANTLPRAAHAATKPKYSVVALEPDHGGKRGGKGGGGSNTSGAQNVVKTIVKTEEPVTQTVAKTGERVTITKSAPTTVPVVPIKGTTMVTVTVTAEPTSRGKAIDFTTTTTTTTTTTAPTAAPTLAVTDSPSISRHLTESSGTGRHWKGANSTSISPPTIATTTTTLALGPSISNSILNNVLVTPSVFSTSTRTYDDGMWHTTYPSWNETAAHEWRRR